MHQMNICDINMNEINLRSIDLNLLVALDVLLEECHVSNSAERLNISQSAMSHIFSRLRHTMKDELLIRGQSGYEKTSRAIEIQEPLKDALTQIQNVLSVNSFDPATYEGSFNIATLGYGEAILIPSFMRLIRKEAPLSKINIIHRPDMSLSQTLSGDVDLMFSAVFEHTNKICKSQLLFEDTYVCLMDKSHPLARGKLSLKSFLAYPHSVIDSGVVATTPIDDALHELGHKRSVAKISSHFMASILALKDTNLLQTVPKKLAKTVLEEHGLIQKELPVQVDTIKFGQLWHGKNDNNPIHKWFRGKIVESMSHSGSP